MSEPYNKVIYKLAKDNKSDFFSEENWYILRHIKMIGKKMGTNYGFVHHPSFTSAMYKPLMRNKKLRTNDDIHVAVRLWRINRTEAEEKYGHISDWDVSYVTDMSYLFKQPHWMEGTIEELSSWWFKEFNDDISRWDVSNVTNMASMFSGAQTFNQDIGRWNVSKVTDMNNMFHCTPVFNQDIGGWDVSNVSNMCSMFHHALEFNQSVMGWNLSNVTNMSRMFFYARSFNQDFENWDLTNITYKEEMFDGSEVWRINNL